MELMRFTGFERFIMLDIDDDCYIFNLETLTGTRLGYRDPLGELIEFMSENSIYYIECKEPFIDSDELQETVEVLAENGNTKELQRLKDLLLNGNAVIA